MELVNLDTLDEKFTVKINGVDYELLQVTPRNVVEVYKTMDKFEKVKKPEEVVQLMKFFFITQPDDDIFLDMTMTKLHKLQEHIVKVVSGDVELPEAKKK